MAADSDRDLVSLTENLNLGGDGGQSDDNRGSSAEVSPTTLLTQSVQELLKTTRAVVSQLPSIVSLASESAHADVQDVAEIFLFHEQNKELADVQSALANAIEALAKSVESSVILHLESLGNPSGSTTSCQTTTQKLFSHFNADIRASVRWFLSKAEHQEVLWRTAEECYKEATNFSGHLRADYYFRSLEEDQSASSHDSDSESGVGSENEDGVDASKIYAASLRTDDERKHDSNRRKEKCWEDFWVRILHNSPGGPTLFNPPASSDIKPSHLEAVPQYLFRTFDQNSRGKNNEYVMASRADNDRRVDILGIKRQTAAKALYDHLKPSYNTGTPADNLMSWTSSFLYAIQYAVYKSQCNNIQPSGIKICIVDTQHFPRGQFLRDIPLLNTYLPTAEALSEEISAFFRFRLDQDDFYNGEYLSQGTVNHAGRSRIVSLAELVEAGLFKLYPEFEVLHDRPQWAKRVRDLREEWSLEQVTTAQEIRHALTIARKCSPSFDRIDLASVILAFKNRKLSSKARPPDQDAPSWADKPVEVNRYWSLFEISGSSDEVSRDLPNRKFLHGYWLRAILE